MRKGKDNGWQEVQKRLLMQLKRKRKMVLSNLPSPRRLMSPRGDVRRVKRKPKRAMKSDGRVPHPEPSATFKPQTCKAVGKDPSRTRNDRLKMLPCEEVCRTAPEDGVGVIPMTGGWG